MEDNKMGFLQHLEDLRVRLMNAAIAVAAAAVICFYFIGYIMEIVRRPLGDMPLVMITPAEGFMTHIKLAIYAGIIIASPIIFWQLWLFFAPALKPRERRVAIPAMVGASGLFFTGALFGFFAVIPIAIRFFIGFGSAELLPYWTISSYISFVFLLLMAFGTTFELPLIVLILARFGVVTVDQLKTSRKFVFLGILVLSAMITPPDIFSQVLLTGPVYVLYEISIILAIMFGQKKAPVSSTESSG